MKRLFLIVALFLPLLLVGCQNKATAGKILEETRKQTSYTLTITSEYLNNDDTNMIEATVKFDGNKAEKTMNDTVVFYEKVNAEVFIYEKIGVSYSKSKISDTELPSSTSFLNKMDGSYFDKVNDGKYTLKTAKYADFTGYLEDSESTSDFVLLASDGKISEISFTMVVAQTTVKVKIVYKSFGSTAVTLPTV